MAVLVIAFILSGAAGLIYESIWSRYLGLLVGHSAYAQLIVLVIFLGGMSLGAWLTGERSTRIRNPLRAYAVVELLAGVLGVAFHPVFVSVTGIAYERLFPALAGTAALTLAKWSIAGLLILPQSILLGTTFPLMAAGAIRLVRGGLGRTLSLMYFANSLGAAVGVLAAGFVLLPWGGLHGTLGTAAALNAVVAVLVLAGGRLLGWDAARAPRPEIAPAGERMPVGEDATVVRLLLVVAFGTAVASFTYEIAWIRMLSLVLGSATHSFELMLSAFILGLAVGAFAVRRHADRLRSPVRALGIVQVAMGTLALATLPVYVWTFGWIAALQEALAPTDAGYRIYAVARYALCLLVMFPATVCAGMTLPLITRTLFATGAGERAIGRVYSLNTLGSIIGVALAAVVLLPVIGLKWLLVAGALADMALGVMLLVWVWEHVPVRHAGRTRAAVVALGGFIFVVVTMTRLDPSVLSSGVFRRGAVPDRGAHIVHYHEDGRTATVTVKQVRGDAAYSLLTNGKPDASMSTAWLEPAARGAPLLELDGDMSTQVLLALTTLAHAPTARTAAVIGQGSGVTSHFMLASPALTRLATIEIEPKMIEASRHFQPFNRRVFEDPRSTFVIDDAKSYFAAGRRRYDVIVSEPSNPWVSGVSSLFTDEFYAQVRDHLAEDGVFGQWLHLYEIDDRLVLSVLAALDRHFDDWALYTTGGLDLLVVASPRGRLAVPRWETVLSWPAVVRDLARAVPVTPVTLDRTFVADRALLHPLLAAGVAPNSDFRPVLDLGAERTRFLRHRADGVLSLATRRFDLARALVGDTVGFDAPLRAGIPATRASGASRGALLRAIRDGGVPDTTGGEAVARVRHSIRTLEATLRSDDPPASWREWFAAVADAEEALHLGTAGVADEAFWQPVHAYVARHAAPPGARAAVDFLYGIARWDWPRVIAAAPVLARANRDDRSWVDAESLRDGVVAAHVRLGDIPAARRALAALTPTGAADPAFELRTRMLYWYLNGGN